MSISLTAEGAANLLRLEVGVITAKKLVLRLFTNDIWPNAGTKASDLAEPKGAGYAPIDLDGEWHVEEGDPARASHPAVKFIFTQPIGAVYGYFLTRRAGIARIKRFDQPILIERVGDAIEICVELTQQNHPSR